MAPITSALVLTATMATAAPNTPRVADELMALEIKLEKASVALDPRPYDEIWSKDFVGIGPDGSTYNKTQHRSALTGGHVRFQSIDIRPVSIRVYSHSAVLIEQRTVKGAFDGKPIDSENLVTNVFVLFRDRKWRKVSEHTTRLQQSSSTPPPK